VAELVGALLGGQQSVAKDQNPPRDQQNASSGCDGTQPGCVREHQSEEAPREDKAAGGPSAQYPAPGREVVLTEYDRKEG
jgi:hypothetical protein